MIKWSGGSMLENNGDDKALECFFWEWGILFIYLYKPTLKYGMTASKY